MNSKGLAHFGCNKLGCNCKSIARLPAHQSASYSHVVSQSPTVREPEGQFPQVRLAY